MLPGNRAPLRAGLALAGLIVLYDVSHKKNPASRWSWGYAVVGLLVTAGRRRGEDVPVRRSAAAAFLSTSISLTLSP